MHNSLVGTECQEYRVARIVKPSLARSFQSVFYDVKGSVLNYATRGVSRRALGACVCVSPGISPAEQTTAVQS